MVSKDIHLRLWLLTATLLMQCLSCSVAFAPALVSPLQDQRSTATTYPPNHVSIRRNLGLGEMEVELNKPLGLLLEEREAGKSAGVCIQEVLPDGSAASSPLVQGDVLVQIHGINVENSDWDTVMDLLTSTSSSDNSAPSNSVSLVISDGLGVPDMPKNVVQTLKTTEDAYLIDAVVRQAVREIRKDGRLGNLKQVEVVVGAGVSSTDDQRRQGMVRFFAILSTDGVSTYSCNVKAAGVEQDDKTIEIVSLSCAKDEGLGQTYDLIQKAPSMR